MFKLVVRSLSAMGLKCRATEEESRSNKVRIAGQDDRKEVFKGWVEVEAFRWSGGDGSFCVMRRDKVRRSSRIPFFFVVFLRLFLWR